MSGVDADGNMSLAVDAPVGGNSSAGSDDKEREIRDAAIDLPFIVELCVRHLNPWYVFRTASAFDPPLMRV